MGGVSERLYSFRAFVFGVKMVWVESVSVFIASELVFGVELVWGVVSERFSFRALCLELSWFGGSQ